jgi:hypothetical protein
MPACFATSCVVFVCGALRIQSTVVCGNGKIRCSFGALWLALIRPPLALKAMLSIAPPTVDALLQVTDRIDLCGAGAGY